MNALKKYHWPSLMLNLIPASEVWLECPPLPLPLTWSVLLLPGKCRQNRSIMYQNIIHAAANPAQTPQRACVRLCVPALVLSQVSSVVSLSALCCWKGRNSGVSPSIRQALPAVQCTPPEVCVPVYCMSASCFPNRMDLNASPTYFLFFRLWFIGLALSSPHWWYVSVGL